MFAPPPNECIFVLLFKIVRACDDNNFGSRQPVLRDVIRGVGSDNVLGRQSSEILVEKDTSGKGSAAERHIVDNCLDSVETI
jgi:hypothetical protein